MPESSQLTITRTVAVRHDVDVFVAGGGPAGVAAAVAAANDGDTRRVDIKELQRRLRSAGACLPNASA